MTTTTATRPVDNSPEAIAARIDVLTDLIAKEEDRAGDLALSALGGGQAAKDYAALTDRISGMYADRDVLNRALDAAKAKTKREATEAEICAKRSADARAADNARKIMATAKRVDLLAADLRTCLEDLDRLEREVWDNIRAAGRTDWNDGFVGRRHLRRLAEAVVHTITVPPTLRARPIGEIAKNAWLSYDDI